MLGAGRGGREALEGRFGGARMGGQGGEEGRTGTILDWRAN